MAGICRCDYLDCEHKDDCRRLKEVGELMNFKAICNKENDYIRIIKIENAITESEETK